MSLEQLSGEHLDAYELLWTRVMRASGVTLIAALMMVCIFWPDMTKMLVFGIVAVASLIVLSVASVKLRALERGLSGSDRKGRSDMHSALEGIDDY